MTIRTRTGELNLGASLFLEFIQVLTTTTYEDAMLSGRDLHSENNAILQGSGSLLELDFYFVDKLGFTPNTDFIRRFPLTRARQMVVNNRSRI